MTWDLLITRIENGFLLTHESELGENIVEEAIVERQKNDKGEWMEEAEQQAVMGEELLWAVIEYFTLHGSRHDSHRVRVVIEPGDKYVGDEA